LNTLDGEGLVARCSAVQNSRSASLSWKGRCGSWALAIRNQGLLSPAARKKSRGPRRPNLMFHFVPIAVRYDGTVSEG
jgi:hypothetical protein